MFGFAVQIFIFLANLGIGLIRSLEENKEGTPAPFFADYTL
jgi:hypothetical protein